MAGMKTSLLSAIFLLAFSVASFAATPAPENLRLAEELCTVMKLDGGYEAMIDQMKKVQERMGVAAGEAQDAAIRDFMLAAQKKARPILAEVYATNFSAEELKGMIEFFKTPVGQAWVERQAVVQTQIMEKMQGVLMEMQPELLKTLMKNLPGRPKTE